MMKPESPDASELVSRLRQQLILAQVRIMELEDVRDSLSPRLAELEQLLRGAQSLADRKLDEAAHLERVLAGLRGQYEELGALAASREETAGRNEVIAGLKSDGAALKAESADRLGQIGRREAELRALQSTRSWRWTAWLRAIGGK